MDVKSAYKRTKTVDVSQIFGVVLTFCLSNLLIGEYKFFGMQEYCFVKFEALPSHTLFLKIFKALFFIHSHMFFTSADSNSGILWSQIFFVK